MFQTAVIQNIKTHILRSIFFIINRDLYEIMWKNAVQPDSSQKTIWSTRVSCWIPKATGTNSELVLLTAFPLEKWLQECASMLRYTYIACLVVFRMIFRVHSHYFPQQEGKRLSF